MVAEDVSGSQPRIRFCSTATSENLGNPSAVFRQLERMLQCRTIPRHGGDLPIRLVVKWYTTRIYLAIVCQRNTMSAGSGETNLQTSHPKCIDVSLSINPTLAAVNARIDELRGLPAECSLGFGAGGCRRNIDRPCKPEISNSRSSIIVDEDIRLHSG